MGAAVGKQLIVVHKRTAGLDTAGTEIVDASAWCMAFATHDEDYVKIQQLYDSIDEEEKAWLHELLIVEDGRIFE